MERNEGEDMTLREGEGMKQVCRRTNRAGLDIRRRHLLGVSLSVAPSIAPIHTCVAQLKNGVRELIFRTTHYQ